MRIGLLVAGVVSSLILGVQAPVNRPQADQPPAAPQPTVTAPVLTNLLAAQAAVLPGELGQSIPPVGGAPRPPLADQPQPGLGSPLPKVDCRKRKCIALTLDDGPSPQTARILDALASLKAPATFFVVGRQVGHYRGVLRRMAAEGHTIGNHSWSHPWFWKLSPAAMRTELDKTDRAIRKLTGVQPRYVRPPYGNVNAAVKQAAKSRGLAIVDWSIDPEDWKVRNTQVVIKRVVGAARPGAIILGHDLYPTTRKAIVPIITKLRAKGYVFVSLENLLGRTRPGKVYRQRG